MSSVSMKTSLPIVEAKQLGCWVEQSWLWRKLDLKVKPGEKLAIVGASGSGKSSLLHMLSGMSSAKEGQVLFQGQVYAQMSDEHLSSLRRKQMGFVYQQAYWLKDLSVSENVAMPLMLQGVDRKQAIERANQELTAYKLESHGNKPCHLLSGGERQRFCLARATITKPSVVFADEPTGNLDAKNTTLVMDYLAALPEHTTLIVVTHEKALEHRFSRVLSLDA